MKIFQLIQCPQSRGVEIFTAQLCDSLSQRGHEVLLISLFSGDYSLPFSGRQIHLGLNTSRRFWDWKAWKAFAHLIEREKPDVIQANAADTLKFAVFSKLLFGWKVPLVFRNASLFSQYIQGFGKKKFNQFLLNRVDGVVSVSEASQKDMQDFFSLKRPKFQVIPIGISLNDLEANFSDSKETELVHIGGFTFEKNHRELLSIFENLSKKYPKLTLRLIGNGPLVDEVNEEIVKRGLETKVKLMGALPKPYLGLSKKSILVLPSRIEGLPAVIVEAIFLKIPVVAYGVGGIPEILKNGETGWCIPPNDSEAFIYAIQEVLEMDQPSKKKILDQAYDLVISNYSLSKVTLQFEEFYQSLLANSESKQDFL
ncbi:MAG: glycosyltransferase family 4 protein [Cytophagia bacterium]|nr:glycosyltransferase family 4 protein [Cytophagia bacterium]